MFNWQMAQQAAKMMSSPEAQKLFNTIEKIVKDEHLTMQQVLGNMSGYIERVECVAKKKGMTVKQVMDDSLKKYEGV